MKLAALLAIILSLIGLSNCEYEWYDSGFCDRLELYECDKATKSCSKEWVCKRSSEGFFPNIEECQRNC